MGMKASGLLARLAIAAVVWGSFACSPAAAAVPSEMCDTETVQAMAPADTTVAFAAREAGGCRIVGYVTTRDPSPNRVLFVLGLPDNFSGTYVYLGMGGAGGQLPLLRSQLLAKGYALAGSDGGSGAKNMADFSFMRDPAKSLDFRGRGVHVTAMATQQITKAYYKQNVAHRYITGCSGGGQMGLTNALNRGTEDFDGFIVGATPWPGDPYLPNVFRIAQYLQTHPDGWLPPDLMARADAAILTAYDATDGAIDGIIADQRNIKTFDLDLLRKVGFTPAQIATFQLIHDPHKIAGGPGDALHPGYPVTHVAAWSAFLLGSKPPPWGETDSHSASEIAAQGAPFIHIMADTDTRASFHGRDYVSVSNPAELSRIAMADGRDASAMNFSKLAASSAKMIVYHGVDDQAMSYLETVKSYEGLRGKYPDVAKFLRVFTVPGLMHCSGGSGPTDVEDRLVEALGKWVEQGQAPDSVVAARSTPVKGVERTFRLCAEPTRASFKGAGLDPKQAENWECRTLPEQR
jgi:feruloyl esterase